MESKKHVHVYHCVHQTYYCLLATFMDNYGLSPDEVALYAFMMKDLEEDPELLEKYKSGEKITQAHLFKEMDQNGKYGENGKHGMDGTDGKNGEVINGGNEDGENEAKRGQKGDGKDDDTSGSFVITCHCPRCKMNYGKMSTWPKMKKKMKKME